MDNSRLRAICVSNNFFTCGDNYQYEKLFAYNETNQHIDSKERNKVLATIIWTCSTGADLLDIELVLNVEDLPWVSISRLSNDLEAMGRSEEDIKLILSGLKNSNDVGVKFKLC